MADTSNFECLFLPFSNLFKNLIYLIKENWTDLLNYDITIWHLRLKVSLQFYGTQK